MLSASPRARKIEAIKIRNFTASHNPVPNFSRTLGTGRGKPARNDLQQMLVSKRVKIVANQIIRLNSTTYEIHIDAGDH